jgi:hypothetical protein
LSANQNGRQECLPHGRRQRQQLERELERARAQAIYDRSLRAFDNAQKELKWVKEGQRDGKPFCDETRREQPVNVQFLKTALRANADLGRVNERDPIENAQAADAAELREQVVQGLLKLRLAAADAGKIEPDSEPELVLGELIKLLVGEPCHRLGWETVMIDGCIASGDHFRRVKRGTSTDEERTPLAC